MEVLVQFKAFTGQNVHKCSYELISISLFWFILAFSSFTHFFSANVNCLWTNLCCSSILSGALHRDRPGQQGPQDAHRQDQAGLRAAHLHRLVPGLGPRVLDQRPPGARHGRAVPLRPPPRTPRHYQASRPLSRSAASTELELRDFFTCQKHHEVFLLFL